MPINPPDSTLTAIQQKVRRLTRSPSTAQLSDDDLNNYINTFVIYDFPEHLRLFNERTQFTFICNAFQDVYNTDTASFVGVTTNQLYDFQNKYLTVHPPLYIAGYQSLYTQSPQQFFNIYPLTNSIASIGQVGNGAQTSFSGVINTSQALINPQTQQQNYVLLQNNVLFSSVDSIGSGVSLVDVPVVDTVTGNPTIHGNLYNPQFLPTSPPTAVLLNNNINYFTGAYTIDFGAGNAPGPGVAINSQTVPSAASLPQAMLFYANQFTLRPIPDQPYRINFEVYPRPTALLATNQSPQLQEFWQYITYGAAKKIFEDRMDMESVALILPEFKKQEALCQRRTIVQYTNERTATIYTEQVGVNGSWQWGWNGSGF